MANIVPVPKYSLCRVRSSFERLNEGTFYEHFIPNLSF